MASQLHSEGQELALVPLWCGGHGRRHRCFSKDKPTAMEARLCRKALWTSWSPAATWVCSDGRKMKLDRGEAHMDTNIADRDNQQKIKFN